MAKKHITYISMLFLMTFFIIGCSGPRSLMKYENAQINNDQKSTLLFVRDDSYVNNYTSAVKVCGREDLIELSRGESASVEIPAGKCPINMAYSKWQGGTYAIEINAEPKKTHKIRIIPRSAFQAVAFLGWIGMFTEGKINGDKSGPFELVEEK